MLALSIALAVQIYHVNYASHRSGKRGLYHFRRERSLFLVILTLIFTQLFLLASDVVRECVGERMDDSAYIALADARLLLVDLRSFISVVAIFVANREFRRDYKRYYLFWRAATAVAVARRCK